MSGRQRRGQRRSWYAASLGLGMVLLAAASAAAREAISATRGDPAARLSDAAGGSEFWDVSAELDSGHRILARFIITNEGPGSHTGVGMGYLVFPDGSTRDFKYGRLSDKWSISDDRLRLKVASAVLDFRGEEQLFEMDSDRSGVKIHLRFARDPKPLSAAPSSEGQRFSDLVRGPAPVTGTLWVEGMPEALAVRGTVTVTHTWMEQSESALALRQIEISALQDQTAIYLSHVLTPGGEVQRWLVIRRGEELLYRSDDFDLAIDARNVPDGDTGYPLPERLRIDAAGISGEIRIRRELLRRDPLEIIPQPFRFLLSLRAKPRRVWAAASFDLKVAAAPDTAALHLDGSGLMTVTYVNPLP